MGDVLVSVSAGASGRWREGRSLLAGGMTAIAALMAMAALAPAAAMACSKDDTNYLDAFLDATCLQTQTSTTLNAGGGVRLTTNGTAGSTTWDTDPQFDSGVTWESVPFAPYGVSTLSRTGTGTAATLQLPTAGLPLQTDGATVISPPASAVGDNDNVEDPAAIKVGSNYVMYYTGTAEDGSGPAIYQATSVNGLAWTRANGGAAVLTGDTGAFDEHGVYGVDVVYDALDVATPYRMWYSGVGDTFGAIGYATSSDGVTWTKYDAGGPDPVPVVDHGLAGGADSFGAGDPSVLKDGSTWRMWYTGDDSSKKRISYASSTDGVAWSKGGSVIAPEDPGVSANLAFGAFAPTVWKQDGDYRMLLVGRKIVSGSTYQTKVLDSNSSDGINWSGPSPAINPSGSASNFDYSNLDGPDLLEDPGQASPFKVYYAGNTVDATGNFHTRIGYATSNNGSAFSKVAGSGAGGSALDVNTLGTAFDARGTTGMTAAIPSGAPVGKKFTGVYSGVRGSDFLPRLGGAYSANGSTWTRVTDGAASGGSLLALGNAPANFDAAGHTDPSLLYDAASGSPHRVYFTAISATGVKSIATAATTEDADKQPVNSAWSTPSRIFQANAGFDANGVSHPSVIQDGPTYRLYYTGTDGSGNTTIGYTSSATATSFVGARTQVITAGGAGTIDASGVKDPVAWKHAAGDYRMVYTAISVLDGKRTERLGYATSIDGASWTKASPSLLLDPSLSPFAFDEANVAAGGVALDGTTPHIWYTGTGRTGRSQVGHATVSGATKVPNGAATYQLGNPTTSVRDFRSITRTSSGSVTLWMSFLQPYSSAGEQYWSDYFPVTAAANPETLNMLLNVRGVRWQARLSSPAGSPSLDTVAISHAPVSFNASGTATTGVVAPPVGVGLNNWSSATVRASLFQPNGSGAGSGTVRVLDAGSAQQLAIASLNTGGDTNVDLSGIAAGAHPQLRFAFDINSADGQGSPLVKSLEVSYNDVVPPTVVALAGSAASVIYGTPLTLSGTVVKGAGGLAGQVVTIEAAPAGSNAFAPATTATTDAAGAFTTAVNPDKALTYRASVAGGSNKPTVAVTVAHLVKLKVTRKGTKGYAKGSVGPVHAAKPVQLQQKKGTRWVTIKKLKTSSTSSFAATVTKLSPRGKYQFRALTDADAEHLAGASEIYYVDKIKLSLSVKRSGRTLTFSGAASPKHPGKVVVIKVLKGSTWSTLAKVKLSRRSTYTLKKKFAPGTFDLRADIAGDRDHWPGRSVVRRVIVP